MINPKWYKAKHGVQAEQLTGENINDIREWINKESNYQMPGNCQSNNHICFVKSKGLYAEYHKLNIGEWIVVDATRQIQVFNDNQFKFLYYEDSYRKVEVVDVLGDY